MYRNKYGYHTPNLKAERRRSQTFMEGEFDPKKNQCRFCGQQMYYLEETPECHYVACHGWIKINGKVEPCPNNVDYHLDKHWRPKSRDIEATAHLLYAPDWQSLLGPVSGRKVA